MLLSVALDGYWLDKQLSFSSNTIAKYNHVFRLFTNFLGTVEVERITTADVRRFLIHLGTTHQWGRRSVHDAWAVLSSFWTWAERELSIPHIIRGKIAAPAYTERKIEPYTQTELRALLQAADYQRVYTLPSGKKAKARRPTASRDRAILLVLVDSGLRVSELCALTVGNYDAPRGRLHIQHDKGDKARFVVIGNRARKALWLYLAGRGTLEPSTPLFTTRTNRPLERNNVRHTLNRLGEAAGISNVHPHRFRHTFAITFLRNGGNPLLLQELLGHERLETVLVYVKLAEQDIDAGQKHSPADNWML